VQLDALARVSVLFANFAWPERFGLRQRVCIAAAVATVQVGASGRLIQELAHLLRLSDGRAVLNHNGRQRPA
jgi:hypothetical protein